jgi:septum site-determining protein MinD
MALQKDFDYIICDSPAGIESGAWHAMYFAGKILIYMSVITAVV